MLTIYHRWTDWNKTADIDLSKLGSDELADTVNDMIQHHTPCSVYLGYLEPGWMLDLKSEIRMRKFIRTFDVHMICFFLESLPFSWKNETDTIYTEHLPTQDGSPKAINDGSTYLNKPKAKHNKTP